MKRKLILILCSALLMGLGTVGTVQAQRSAPPASTQSAPVSYLEKVQVCSRMDDLRILDLRLALVYLRNGQLDIGKLGHGHYYAMVNGGPMISILIDDNV